MMVVVRFLCGLCDYVYNTLHVRDVMLVSACLLHNRSPIPLQVQVVWTLNTKLALLISGTTLMCSIS